MNPINPGYVGRLWTPARYAERQLDISRTPHRQRSLRRPKSLRRRGASWSFGPLNSNEAVYRYRQGEKWWIDDPEITEVVVAEQERRAPGDDVWQKTVESYLSEVLRQPRDRWTTVFDVLRHGLAMVPADMTKREIDRVARCLVAAGWQRHRATVLDAKGEIVRKPNGAPDRPWRYYPISDLQTTS